MNKKVLISIIILSTIVLILGLHGGADYYFRDFCVHKTLNMFYHGGSPDFYKKPGFVSDLEAIAYAIFYFFLKHSHNVSNFDEFVRYFSTGYIPTNAGNLSFMFPALIVNNIFSVIGVCFSFLTTYLLTKRIFPSFVAGFMLATSPIWMSLSHHLTVDIPLTAICIMVIFYSIYFIQKKEKYSRKELLILGLLCGLAFATKYNGLLVIVAPLSVLFVSQRNIRELFFDLLTFVMGLLFAFYVTNPYIFWAFSDFKLDFSQEFIHAFSFGHNAADSRYPLLFHIFHSFPIALGFIPFICSIFGAVLFIKDCKKFPITILLAVLLFPLIFLVMLSRSVLVFLRYTLPIIPVFTVFIGYLVYSVINKLNIKKIYNYMIYSGVVLLLFLSSCKAAGFYKLMSTNDTRIGIKQIFKELKIDKNETIYYTDIFSNPYYNDDFLGKYPKIKDNLYIYLYGTNYTSIYIMPWMSNTVLRDYSIIIMDSATFDRAIQIRKDKKYSHIENQYFMYTPFVFGRMWLKPPKKKLYVAQINPYKVDKSKVPFGLLRNEGKYRLSRGPYVEIYFRNKKLRNDFIHRCPKYSLQCRGVNMTEGYYFKNYISEVF